MKTSEKVVVASSVAVVLLAAAWTRFTLPLVAAAILLTPYSAILAALLGLAFVLAPPTGSDRFAWDSHADSVGRKSPTGATDGWLNPRLLGYFHLMLAIHACLLVLHDTRRLPISEGLYLIKEVLLADLLVVPFVLPVVSCVMWRRTNRKAWLYCLFVNLACTWCQWYCLITLSAD